MWLYERIKVDSVTAPWLVVKISPMIKTTDCSLEMTRNLNRVRVMMQNLSSVLGKARRVLYQVKFTDSYKYRKNLVHAQVVPRFFISLGDGVCF